MRELIDLIGPLRGAQSLDDLRRIAATTFADLGITAYTYGGARLPRSGSAAPVIITTYPQDWVTHYVERGFQQRDPVVACGMATMLPFLWSDLNPTKTQRQVFEEGRSAGLISGLSVPIHGPSGEFALVSLASDMPAVEFATYVETYRYHLHLAAIYCHASVSDLSAMNVEANKAITLTSREVEVLSWIARGKTAWEVSELLNIAESTVVFHVENAKRKLGVFSRSYAVAKAISLGLISP
jgi:DNA-binding CsgD family transcriptional regulator